MSYVTQAETLREPLAPRELAHFWREDRFDDLECLRTRFHTHVYARHTHDTYVIGAITAGCELFEVKGVRHGGRAGELVFVHPDEVHDGAPASGGYAYRMIYPSVALIAGLAEELTGRGLGGMPAFPTPVARDPELAAAFVRAHQALERGAEALEGEEAMIAVLGRILARHAHIAAVEGAPDERRAVVRAKAFLLACPAENVDLRTLATIAGLSRSQLIRAFRRTTGLTPHAFLLDRRVRLARDLLRGGKPPVEAAAAAGFADQAHLTRAFKARVGVTPGLYLRMI